MGRVQHERQEAAFGEAAAGGSRRQPAAAGGGGGSSDVRTYLAPSLFICERHGLTGAAETTHRRFNSSNQAAFGWRHF